MDAFRVHGPLDLAAVYWLQYMLHWSHIVTTDVWNYVIYLRCSSLFCYCGKRGFDGFCCTQINACWTTGCSLCCYLCRCIISYVVLIALCHMECAPVDCNRLVLFLNRFSEKSPVSHVACHLSETNSHPLLRSTPDLVPPTMMLGRYQSLISWHIL